MYSKYFGLLISLEIVLAQYLFRCAGVTATNWQLKGVAIAGYTVAFLRKVFAAFESRMQANFVWHSRLFPHPRLVSPIQRHWRGQGPDARLHWNHRPCCPRGPHESAESHRQFPECFPELQ